MAYLLFSLKYSVLCEVKFNIQQPQSEHPNNINKFNVNLKNKKIALFFLCVAFSNQDRFTVK